MRRQLVIRKDHWEHLRATLLRDAKEVSMYALVGRSTTSRRDRILVRELLPLSESDYDRRTEHSIQVKPSFINSVAGRCEREGLGLLMTHSHPFEEGDVWFSPTDDAGEERVLRVFNELGGGAWPLASLVLAPGTVKARTWEFSNSGSRHHAIDEVVIIGDRCERRAMVGAKGEIVELSPIHDRQVLAFGRDGQRHLARTTAAVIGAGGTGSITAEMLGRLGVGTIHIIDPDALEESNLSRVFGSTKKDIGREKVDVLASWIRAIGPSRAHAHAMTVDKALQALVDADVIFACTDTESSRAFANQVSYQHMIPLIEMGNRIDAKDGRISAASTRLTIVGPGKPCLECYGSIQHDRVAAELMPRAEYESRKKEGYVADLDARDPSVVSLNTFVAAQAITRFLDMFTAAGGPPWNKWTYDYLEGELRPATTRRRETCVCTHYEGYGDLKTVDLRTGVK